MRTVTLGKTGITSPQNAFGALPIQRISLEAAVELLHKAYDGGMTFFDTARAYSDSEIKVGIAFEHMREKICLASKTTATTPEQFWADLDTTLKNLRHLTDPGKLLFISVESHIRAGLPTMWSSGTNPQYLESSELCLLSPIIK